MGIPANGAPTRFNKSIEKMKLLGGYMKKKFLCLSLILSICLFSLTGCYDAAGIEDLSYAIAIGLDKGENNILKLSIQFATPSSMGNNSEGSSQSSTTTITSIECSSISSGINLINGYISKKVNLSHCKVIVISESLATLGVSEYIYTFMDNVEVRPNCNIIVSKCDAINFLENAKPTLEKLTARYYEAALNSSEYTGYTADVQLIDFYSALKSSTTEPIAILAGINTSNTHLDPQYINKFNIDSSYKASQTPIKDKTSLECTGLAVFKEDKLVGELNGIESICYSILSGKLDNCMITIQNPLSFDDSIDIYLDYKIRPKITVKMVNLTPYIDIDLAFNAYIASADRSSEHSSSESLEIIGKSASKYLKEQISAFSYKTSKDFKCDIVGFGKYAIINYLTSEDWLNSDWLSNYESSTFNVNVSVNVNSGELFSKM